MCGQTIGGIVGWQDENGTIQKCVNYGEVIGLHASAGIVGSAAGTIKECINEGTIKGKTGISSKTNSIGGIAAYAGWSQKIMIENCYNKGSLIPLQTTGVNIGGIVGRYNGPTNSNTIIKNCYNIGQITVAGIVGGIAGDCSYGVGTVTNNYWLTGCGATYGIGKTSSNNGAIGKTQIDMKTIVNLLGDAYQEDSKNMNDGYPILKWQVEK